MERPDAPPPSTEVSPSQRVVCCIDSVVGGPAPGLVLASGWCLCSQAIISMAVRLVDGAQLEARYGDQRPDVAVAHPGFPNGERCAFAALAPEGARDMALELVLQDADGRRARALVTVTVHHRGVQTPVLQPLQLAAVARDAEAALQTFLARGPGLILRMDVSSTCNLRCWMCHFSSDTVRHAARHKLTLDEFKTLFVEVAPHVRELMLSCACEPLAAPILPQILSWVAETYPHVEVSFSTNCTLLNEQACRMVIESGLIRLVVSLDGVSANTVERIRVGASYDRIIHNLLTLASLKESARTAFPTLSLTYVMMGSNLHETPAFVELADELGANYVTFLRLFPNPHFVPGGELLESHKAAFNHTRIQVLAAAARRGLAISIPEPFPDPGPLPGRLLAPPGLEDFERVRSSFSAPDPAHPPRRGRPSGFEPFDCVEAIHRAFPEVLCPRPFFEMFVGENGDIKPCPFYLGELGWLQVNGAGLADLFRGSSARALRQALMDGELPSGCRECPYQGGFFRF